MSSVDSSVETKRGVPAAKLLGLPNWLFFSLLSMLLWGLWGLVSKRAVELSSPLHNQVLSTFGFVLPVALLVRSKNLGVGTAKRRGASWAFLTGLCGGLGNVALFLSFSHGAKASVVIPLTGVYPLVSVALAVILLKEKLNAVQIGGIILALAALVLLNQA
jgi:transporter family protein